MSTLHEMAEAIRDAEKRRPVVRETLPEDWAQFAAYAQLDVGAELPKTVNRDFASGCAD